MENPRLEINNLSLPAYRTFSTVYRTSTHTQLKLIQLNLDEIHHIQPKTKPLKSIKILQQRFYNVDGYARADSAYVYIRIQSEQSFIQTFCIFILWLDILFHFIKSVKSRFLILFNEKCSKY